MEILHKNEIRKEFYNLIENQGFSFETAINKLLQKLSSGDYFLIDTNKIYVYMGTYKIVHECPTSWYPLHNVFVSKEDPTAEYKLFRELDTGLESAISINDKYDELDSFERNNTIIYIPNARPYEDKHTFELDFLKLRKMYLEDLCAYGEEIAIKHATSNDYLNIVFSVINFMNENNINPIWLQLFNRIALSNIEKDSYGVFVKKLKK